MEGTDICANTGWILKSTVGRAEGGSNRSSHSSSILIKWLNIMIDEYWRVNIISEEWNSITELRAHSFRYCGKIEVKYSWNRGRGRPMRVPFICGRLVGLRKQERSFADFNVYSCILFYIPPSFTLFYWCIMSYYSFMDFNWYILYYLERTIFGIVLQRYMSSEAIGDVTFYHKDEFEVEFIYLIRLCLWDFLIFVYSGFTIKHSFSSWINIEFS